MNRAERRHRTEKVVKKRMKETTYPTIPGKCKKKHPLDCGKTNCRYCRDEDRKRDKHVDID
jgi:hypothetical protein